MLAGVLAAAGSENRARPRTRGTCPRRHVLRCTRSCRSAQACTVSAAGGEAVGEAWLEIVTVIIHGPEDAVARGPGRKS